MLKKIGHISLIILLLLATSGVNIYRHYCGSVLMKETVLLPPSPCCSDHCKSCHNEVSHLKVTDNFETSSFKIDFKTYLSRLFDYSQFQQILYQGADIGGFTEIIQVRAVKHNYPSYLLAEDKEAHLQVFRL